jgi:hypothetical protein
MLFGFLVGALPGEAYDTVGVNVTPFNFHQPNLVEIRWKADVTEFVNLDPSTDDLRIEFNGVGFAGPLGGVGMGVMIQNVLHHYPEPSCDVDSLSGGLELYFSVIDDLERSSELIAGVALAAGAANSSPAFRRVFQDIDGLRIVGNNIYATAAIGDERISDPVTIEWHLKRGRLVANPPGNLKRDIACNWVPLLGDFREWMVEVTVDGVHHPVATYYLPEVYASYLDPFGPLTLHQEHFQACDNRLDINKTDVVYYDFGVRKEGSSQWLPMPNWQINYSYAGECEPAPSDLRHGIGTSVRNGKKVLRSRSGHENDIDLKRCDVESGASFFTCSQPVLFSGIDLPPTTEEVTISNLSVSLGGSAATLRWNTSRPTDGMIQYGKTPDLGSSSAASLTFTTDHSTVIEGLESGIYFYRLESIARNGHLATQDGVFGTVGPCVSDAETACLVGGRFEVKVGWQRATSSGPAQVMKFGGQRAETNESAFFWFFSQSNFEIGLKILNACGINQKYWVFISGLTNQGWTVYIRDTVTGTVKTYSNPLGHLTSTTADTSSGLSCS